MWVNVCVLTHLCPFQNPSSGLSSSGAPKPSVKVHLSRKKGSVLFLTLNDRNNSNSNNNNNNNKNHNNNNNNN